MGSLYAVLNRAGDAEIRKAMEDYDSNVRCNETLKGKRDELGKGKHDEAERLENK